MIFVFIVLWEIDKLKEIMTVQQPHLDLSILEHDQGQGMVFKAFLKLGGEATRKQVEAVIGVKDIGYLLRRLANWNYIRLERKVVNGKKIYIWVLTDEYKCLIKN